MNDLFSIKVKEVFEVPSYIKEKYVINLKNGAFIIYGKTLAGSDLHVREYLTYKDMIFKVITFPMVKDKPYIKDHIHSLLEPYCLASRALDKDELFSELNNAILTHEIDFEKIMNSSHNAEKITPATKINYLFQSMQRIISKLDPWGLLCAPIDEYDDLVSKIVSYFVKTKNIDFYDVEKMIRDYCEMQYVKEESIAAAISELKQINLSVYI